MILICRNFKSAIVFISQQLDKVYADTQMRLYKAIWFLMGFI